MEKKHSEVCTAEELDALRNEVKQLETVTLIAIDDFEKKLCALDDIPDVSHEENWTPRLDTIEIYSMEKHPPLSESIRRIDPV